MRGAIADAGHDAVIKPRPMTVAVEGGFTVDEAAATVTCPVGHTRPINKARNVIFGVLCRDCPLAARCTTSTTGRTLKLHKRDNLLRQARRAWADEPDLRDNYRKNRPNVERVINLRNLVGRDLTRAAGAWILTPQTA